MDRKRLLELCGINEATIVSPVKQASGKNKNAATIKTNNKMPKAKSADDVSTDGNQVVAVLDDIDDSGITVKAGKKDVNGNKIMRKGERLTHTISINDKGAAQVDDQLDNQTMDINKWGELSEEGAIGYIVASEEDLYAKLDEEFIEITDQRDQATVFNSLDKAQQFADMFENSQIRQLTVESSCSSMENEEKCADCECDPCECSEEDEEVEQCADCECDPCECSEEDGKMNESTEDRSIQLLKMLRVMLAKQKIVPVSVVSGGKPFVGTLSNIGKNSMMVKPNSYTKQIYNLLSYDPQVVRFNPTDLKWNREKNRLEGIVADFAQVDDNANKSPMGHEDSGKMTSTGQPGRPIPGKVADPSTWRVDMSSATPPVGASLMEHIRWRKMQKAKNN